MNSAAAPGGTGSEGPGASLPLVMTPATGGENDADPTPPETPSTSTCQPRPRSTGTGRVSDTLEVSGTFDGGLKRFVGVGDLGSGS